MVNEDKISIAMPFSKGGLARLRATWRACETVDAHNLSGAFVECGVWRGGMVMVARWASPSRQCWLYDTFAGMTEPGPNDKKRNNKVIIGDNWIGKSAVSSDDVQRNLQNVGVYDPDKIVFVVGDVRKTLTDFATSNLPEQIAVLRLDTDFYDSTKAELEVLYPRLVSGGILILDDYGHWMGSRQAADEYLGDNRRLLRSVDYACYLMDKP